MKKVLIAFVAFFFPILLVDVSASCHSPNGKRDNGKCDKTDINNKFCVGAISPYDCYVEDVTGGGY